VIRRGITVAVVAVATAGGLLYWLHDGNWRSALADGRTAARWDADGLARDAGIEAQHSSDPAPVAPSGPVLATDGGLSEPAGPAGQ
jgi:hypothetical protein